MSESTIATGPAPGANLSGVHEGADPVDKPIGSPKLRPAAVFSHAMVLQRRQPIPVFGTGAPGRTVIATLSSPDQGRPITLHTPDASDAVSDSVSAFATIDRQGDWLLALPAVEAGGPYTLTVSDRSGIMLKYLDVHVGEVWLAGGQSNMELELRNSAGADQAVAASADPLLRFYNTPKTGVIDTDAEDHAAWQIAGPDTSGTMSAVAYYFARRLRAELGPDVPVGIVDCYIGGTSITSWMSRDTLRTCEAGRGYLARFDAAIADKTDEQFAAETDDWQTKFNTWNDAIGKARAAEPDITWDTLNARYGECPWPPPVTPTSQYRPAGPFGTMIERVAPYGIAGFLWYQGEEDEAYCGSYRELLGLLIREWRDLWQPGRQAATGDGAPHCATAEDAQGRDAWPPFLIVQLPQWIDKNTAAANADPLHWPVIREAQTDAARAIAGVHAICTMDCGEFDNIHPTDKRTPGERLADCALRHVYGRSDVPADGPTLIAAAATAATAGTAATAAATVSGQTPSVCSAPHTVTLCFAHAAGLRFDGTVPGTQRHVRGASGRDTPENQSGTTYRHAEDSGFELASGDGVFHPAAATIDGDTVTVTAAEAPDPVAVRYAWRSWGPAPLCNGDGLPAWPFGATL